MLSPEQSAYARLNLQLTLEQAELALLRGNAALYQRTLQKARTLLNTWYDARQRQVMTLRDQIDELANQDIQPVRVMPIILKAGSTVNTTRWYLIARLFWRFPRQF